MFCELVCRGELEEELLFDNTSFANCSFLTKKNSLIRHQCRAAAVSITSSSLATQSQFYYHPQSSAPFAVSLDVSTSLTSSRRAWNGEWCCSVDSFIDTVKGGRGSEAGVGGAAESKYHHRGHRPHCAFLLEHWRYTQCFCGCISYWDTSVTVPFLDKDRMRNKLKENTKHGAFDWCNMAKNKQKKDPRTCWCKML